MRRITTVFALAGLLVAGAGLAEAGWEEGVAALKANNLDAAASEFREVVEKTPDFAGGHFMLGQVLLKQGKSSEALASLRKAYELESGNVSYQFSLAQAYLANQRWADGVQMLKRINPASLDKKQQEAYHQMMAMALQKSGNGDEALGALKKITETNPKDADGWYAYGTALFNSGEVAKAVAALETSVRLDGADARKTSALAKALIRQAREANGAAKQAAYDKATAAAQTLVNASPSYDNLLTLGEVQLGAGNYQSAVQTLKKAAAKNGGDWFPHFYMAQAYTLLGQYAEADSAAQAALAKAPGDKERKMVWRQVGFAKEKMKDYDEAKAAYLKAGEPQSAQRVEQNQKIASENQQIEQDNAELEKQRQERERLQKELEELGGPPRH